MVRPMVRQGDRSFWIFNALVSTTAVGFLGWLLLVREGGGVNADLGFMPGVNAALNATSATLLVAGFIAIRNGRREIHKRLMVSAFAASAVFLVGYILYHYAHGDTPYQGEGSIRIAYFTILISHVLLSIVMLPMILTTFFLAARERFATHKRLARWTLPIWLYVSITGVVIYFMLR
jgi:putative membrane protein